MSGERYNNPKCSIFMVGAFPPPINGLAVVNAAICSKLHSIGIFPNIFDTALSYAFFKRTFPGRLARFPKVIKELFRFALAKRSFQKKFYISISGGYGKVYEILFLILARLRGMRIFLHHHSASYLTKKSYLVQLLVAVAGEQAIHITQSNRLSNALRSKYYSIKKTIGISNAAIVLEPLNNNFHRKEVRTIGFLSNLSDEKGVFEFISIVKLLQRKGVQIKAILAGPFQNKKTQRAVLNEIDMLCNIEYIGPVYGHAKDFFFLSIDVFIFPTKYKNETEGIVNLEAMRYSVPVIAYGRGAIPEIIDSHCGWVINVNKPFAPNAIRKLIEWFESPEIFRKKSCGARDRFYIKYLESQKNLTWLIDNLCDH